MREYNFDGLVGLTHNYGGHSPGNVASTIHQGEVANPRAAALEGLAKMKFVHDMGVGQAVLPPHQSPSLQTVRQLGFVGTDEEVITRAARENDHLLRLCSSAAAMWTANAATVAPSSDTFDHRVHDTTANLCCMLHRAIEADTTHSVLRAVFADQSHFAVHAPLPGGGQFSDEGAANHLRLVDGSERGVHLFAWGRRAWGEFRGPHKYPARQTLEASEAVARLHQLDAARVHFVQQDPDGIDAGAFHTDVLAVGNGSFLMLHERAFLDHQALLPRLSGVSVEVANERELPVDDAVRAYPFNSQVLTLPDGSMVIVAPEDSRETPTARRFLERVVAGENPVTGVHYLDVRQSMHNGGGPACLRLRVSLTEHEVRAISANVMYSDALHRALTRWVGKHYRDRLLPSDLSDPALARENMTALDELTGILRLGSVYDFQRSVSFSD